MSCHCYSRQTYGIHTLFMNTVLYNVTHQLRLGQMIQPHSKQVMRVNAKTCTIIVSQMLLKAPFVERVL